MDSSDRDRPMLESCNAIRWECSTNGAIDAYNFNICLKIRLNVLLSNGWLIINGLDAMITIKLFLINKPFVSLESFRSIRW